MKYVPVLEDVENESVGMVFRFGALDGLVKVRIENFPGGIDALHAVPREGIPELLADQHHALAIFFVGGIVVRLERPVESIEDGNQIRDQAFDAATRLIMAVTLDPLRTDSHLGLGYLLYVAGRYDKAEAALQKALDLNPRAAFVHLTLGKILIAKGKPQQALAEIEKETLGWGKLTGQALAYHALGNQQNSNAALADLIAKYGTYAAYQIAQVYAFRGESDKSFEWLDRAYQQRDAGLPEIKTDPQLKNLRRDPRYVELLKKLRLPG